MVNTSMESGGAIPNFALKAAVIDFEQLRARAAALDDAGLPIRLELHTFGTRDIDDPSATQRALLNVVRLKSEHEVASIVVHVPLQSVSVVTDVMFDIDQCIRSIAFAKRRCQRGSRSSILWNGVRI